jgi:hypothetical protein
VEVAISVVLVVFQRLAFVEAVQMDLLVTRSHQAVLGLGLIQKERGIVESLDHSVEEGKSSARMDPLEEAVEIFAEVVVQMDQRQLVEAPVVEVQRDPSLVRNRVEALAALGTDAVGVDRRDRRPVGQLKWVVTCEQAAL